MISQILYSISRLDPSIDLSDDKYVFICIDGSSNNRRLIQKCLIKESEYLIPLTKNKSIIDTITELFCSGNQLTDINGIENLTNLIELNCSNYNLTNLKGIENLIQLEQLKCYSNQLTSLKGIENLNELRYLEFSNNQLNPPYSGSIKKEQERLKQLDI